MADAESPLIKALPPESDYLTYLTIVEYHLSSENLPILHKVLQDETLTTNIGWDLVHLLVPYLPESEQCLHDIARLGNPREVILKVTESLRLIEYNDDAEGSDEDEEATGSGASDVRERADSSTYPLKTAPTSEAEKRPVSSQARELPPPLSLQTNQFIVLSSMLAILHGRINTKHPSRFLSTTLQAVLASFSNSTARREEMVLAVVMFVKAVIGAKRPALPTRQSSGMLKSSGKMTNYPPAADPEASGGSIVTTEETAMQTKLIQSFITHIIEEYMLNLASTDDDVPGMAWCSRMMEKIHPERNIPKATTMTTRFATEENLHRRIDATGQLVTVAQDPDLKITDDDLLSAAITVEQVPARDDQDEDEPPASADEVPLSRLGSLMLYAARQASNILYSRPLPTRRQPFTIFPDHQELLKHCLASPEQGTGALGTEPEALIDAVLSVGILALERNAIGEPASDEEFNEYLQVTALLSSRCPSPNLRGHAHYLTSTILRSHPDEKVRLAFIRDTLEDCPFENLKVSAVGWIKGETIEANPPTPPHDHGPDSPQGIEDETPSIFSTSLALDSLSPFLFPSLHTDLITAPLDEAWLHFRANLSFYLASLNFLYLLLCAKHLHDNLSIRDLWSNNDVAGSFLQPLREASERFRNSEAEELGDEVAAELNVLDEAIERVKRVVRFLNEA